MALLATPGADGGVYPLLAKHGEVNSLRSEPTSPFSAAWTAFLLAREAVHLSRGGGRAPDEGLGARLQPTLQGAAADLGRGEAIALAIAVLLRDVAWRAVQEERALAHLRTREPAILEARLVDGATACSRHAHRRQTRVCK
eukprot:6206226-Pleurochrysis_carterae.AAC.3